MPHTRATVCRATPGATAQLDQVLRRTLRALSCDPTRAAAQLAAFAGEAPARRCAAAAEHRTIRMPFYASERTRAKADGHHRKLRVYQQWQGNEVSPRGVDVAAG